LRIAVLHHGRAEEQGGPCRREDEEHHAQWQEGEQLDRRQPATGQECRRTRQHQADGQIDEPRQPRRRRRHDARERHLREEVGVAYQARRATADRRRDVRPRTEADEGECEVGGSRRVELRQPVEQQRERQGPDQRLDDRPRSAEERLLVPDLDIAQCEEGDQLAVGQELPDAQRRPPADGRSVDEPVVIRARRFLGSGRLDRAASLRQRSGRPCADERFAHAGRVDQAVLHGTRIQLRRGELAAPEPV
jgi:hypothetical protein